MQGVVGGKNVPFTLPQRMELEQQMLIYNYIRANVPIPANLLSSLRRGLNTSGLSGSYRPNAAWWGYFHPGFAGNADPEPGRCRRTDGKKWRCSRDAVPDQKYCERHINRGRHRSRKPVEGQGGHAKKPMQIISNPTSASAVSSGGQSSNELTVGGKLIQNPQPTADTPPSQLWILAGGKAVNDHGEKAAVPLIVSSTPKPFNSLFSTSKSCSPLELDSGDCLLSQLGGAFAATNNNTNFSSPLELHDWPSSLSDCSTITWPGAAEEMQPERSQLSLPFPMTSSDFSSSSSSPTAEKLSPLHMGLGIRGFTNELNRFQMSWRSSPWEAPARASAAMAGPLGEALASTGAAGMDENKIFLSLMNESWDLSPQLASSTRTHMQHTALSSASSASGNDLAAAEKNTTQEGFSCFFGTKNPNSSSFPL
ncbi:Growth-regulating factor 6 [Apostasia shenzhenica]|uniref:Growth-regulating factor n=1 Tax=Apostasia shenzhenica TaxID=1088818 RepID=A0A2I0BDV4_9ASPA|nr:Growth-regulating factor 6 [Apostasia shenzhenica]